MKFMLMIVTVIPTTKLLLLLAVAFLWKRLEQVVAEAFIISFCVIRMLSMTA